MASLLEIYIKEDTLKVLLDTVQKKQLKGVGITLAVNDELNQFDQNISAYVSQTKEEREIKKQKYYVGNGKVVWTDGKIVKAEKNNVQQQNHVQISQPANNPQSDDDLPF